MPEPPSVINHSEVWDRKEERALELIADLWDVLHRIDGILRDYQKTRNKKLIEELKTLARRRKAIIRAIDRIVKDTYLDKRIENLLSEGEK